MVTDSGRGGRAASSVTAPEAPDPAVPTVRSSVTAGRRLPSHDCGRDGQDGAVTGAITKPFDCPAMSMSNAHLCPLPGVDRMALLTDVNNNNNNNADRPHCVAVVRTKRVDY